MLNGFPDIAVIFTKLAHEHIDSGDGVLSNTAGIVIRNSVAFSVFAKIVLTRNNLERTCGTRRRVVVIRADGSNIVLVARFIGTQSKKKFKIREIHFLRDFFNSLDNVRLRDDDRVLCNSRLYRGGRLCRLLRCKTARNCISVVTEMNVIGPVVLTIRPVLCFIFVKRHQVDLSTIIFELMT